MAIAFFMTDGIATYNNIFVHEYRKAPWMMLLQDHGLGGNYDRFGRGGILDIIISRSGIRPEFVMLGQATVIWRGYDRVLGVQDVRGGMHDGYRCLYRAVTDSE